MIDFRGVSQDFLSDPTLIDGIRSELWPESLELLARLRRRVLENRIVLTEHVKKFDKAYEEMAASGLDADSLVRLAGAVLKAERGVAEQLYPWMEALSERLAPQSGPAQEARQYLQELHDIAVASLATYQTLRERLFKLASERRDNSGAVLRARPVTGDIDYTELSREHIARYPKIRAALAK